MRTVTLLLTLAIAAWSQTPSSQPSYILGAGVSYDYYGKQPAVLTTFAARVADSTYSLTSIETGTQAGQTAASLRTGIMRLLTQPGNWTLFVLGDGGITVNGGATLGNFSGGGGLAYDIGSRVKAAGHLYLTGIVRLTDITSQQVKPVYEFEIGKTF